MKILILLLALYLATGCVISTTGPGDVTCQDVDYVSPDGSTGSERQCLPDGCEDNPVCYASVRHAAH